MAITTRTIQAPGVEIREFDLSERLPTPAGTSTYITGFANQGPTDQVVSVTSLGEFESIYGQPTNAAERYFYHTVKGTLQGSNARVNVNRLPYGANTGVGFGSYYTALVFPTVFYNAGTSALTTNLDGVSGTYFLGKPKLFSITKSDYESIVDGTGFTWGKTALSSVSNITSVGAFSGAGMIVVNKGQTTIDQQFKGYYLGFVDNVDADNIGSAFNKVQTALTVSTTAAGTGLTGFTTIPNSVLTFALTAASGSGASSISYVMETASKGYIIGNDAQYDDVLNLGVFKLTNSVFQDDPNKLIYVPEEIYTGSLTNPFRQFAPPNGGQAVTYSLQNIVADRSPNISILVNPYITNQALDSLGKGSSYDSNSSVKTLKKVRTINNNMVSNYATLSSFVGYSIPLSVIQTASAMDYVDSLLPLGSYNPTGPDAQKVIGNLPGKLNRALEKIKDDEVYDIDILVEGGLGTVYAATQASGSTSYDDTANIESALTGIRVSSNVTGQTIQTNYNAVINEFLGVATTYQNGGRGDTFFIADPIRQIFVTGANSKVAEQDSYVYSTDVYWALRNLYNSVDTSYAATYANWVAVIDPVTNVKTWVPASGFVASRMAATDALIGPWIAPAGFNRGVLQGVIDLAWSPTQRQRDDLYKARLNPIAQFPGQGNVVYGQKTLQTKPSAFDRVNVRRGFLYYEKAVKGTMKFFVFEPNTEFLRGRVLATLNPFFERIRAAEGVYDFLVVCDDRNNSTDTIDNNELIVDIYLKPVRSAEFILVNFYATRTSANFEELVARA
jgi:hypothetical protein